ncbi:LuxR C-terminal-related transcriptional regulator [Microvirga splendida]|uniref:Response regulator transcription factor n=1 Tax=Microvirga splendida TaxID=2795727 RepID=A0ABS0XY83_9HYPH|nr:response regulator transcription factor [Microvirga splendida]MBJ6125027.1 response regulator transcription factor [Microvirga splendida]
MKEGFRVCVVARQPLFRDGVVLALNSQIDIEVVGHGSTIEDAIRLSEERTPDIVVIDAGAFCPSMEAVETLLQQNTKLGILLLADTAEEEHVYTALKRGVRGYILKGASSAELLQAVAVLGQGQSFISPSLAAKLLIRSGPLQYVEVKASSPNLPHLTPRERQILSILVQGRSNKEIGNTLDLSEKTIKHHLTNILQKLRVRNRVEAALMMSKYVPQHQTLS